MPRPAEGRPKALSAARHYGVVTSLFTDVEGSPALKRWLGHRVRVDLAEKHRASIRQVLVAFEEAEEVIAARRPHFVRVPRRAEPGCGKVEEIAALRGFP